MIVRALTVALLLLFPTLTLAAPSAPVAAPAAAAVPAAPAASGVSPAAPEVLPYARPNRLAVSLGFGFGSASLSRFHDFLDAVVQNVEGPKSGLQINAEIGVRYYFPYFVLAEVGYGALYNWAHKDYGPAKLDSYNLLMEIPLVVGGYYPFIRRLYVHGGLGPSIFFYPRAFLDPSPDFKADSGVGLHVVAGADYLVTEHFAVGLEVRYRYLKSGDLQCIDPTMFPSGKICPAGTAVTSDMLRNDGSSEPYNLDFSGVSLGINLRLFAL